MNCPGQCSTIFLNTQILILSPFFNLLYGVFEHRPREQEEVNEISEEELTNDQNTLSEDDMSDAQKEELVIASEPDESKYGQNPFQIIGSSIHIYIFKINFS